MRRKRSGWNIIVAGFWNRMIFTPEWVSPRLFQDPQIETIVALLPVLPLIYRNDEAAIEVTTLRLTFIPRQLEADQSLLRAETMARTVLEALPETPLQGVGVNFAYKEETPSDALLAIFNVADEGDLAQQNFTIGERKITRKLTRAGGILNLAMTYDGAAVTFDFNFHSETTTSEAALATVAAGRVVQLRDAALMLLDEAYHLGLDDEGDADE